MSSRRNKFGARCKAIRKTCDLTQKQLGKLLGTKETTIISSWEKEGSTPREEMQVRINQVYSWSCA